MERNNAVAAAATVGVILIAWYVAGLWGLITGLGVGVLIYLAPDAKTAGHMAGFAYLILWFIPGLFIVGYPIAALCGLGVIILGLMTHLGES